MADPPPPQPSRCRQTVYFSGRVQGVGFRYTAERLAAGFDVAGFVRNLTDGRVELIIEGPESQLDGFRDAIAREMVGNIASDAMLESEPTGEFDGFHITS